MADYLGETYDAIFPRLVRFPNSVLTGRPARILRKDDLETRRGAERENDSAFILWLRGHNVEQKPSVSGRKNPDYRIDGEIFDNYAPRSGNPKNVWANIAGKVNENQAPNIIVNLADSPLSIAEFNMMIQTNPIPGLNRLWLIERNGTIIYLVGAP